MNFRISLVTMVLGSAAIFITSIAAQQAEPPVTLKPFPARNAPVDIGVDIKESHGHIERILVTGVRKDSVAEQRGVVVGAEIVGYRGTKVVGLTAKEFQTLRDTPIAQVDTTLDLQLKETWGAVHTVALPIPKEAREALAPAWAADRLTEQLEESQHVTEIFEVPLRRPIVLADAASKVLLGRNACRALMDWQIQSLGDWRQEILWAQPMVADGKMTSWRVARRLTLQENGEKLRVDYFDLKTKPAAYPGIENEIRAAYEKSGKLKRGDEIGLFSVLYAQERAIGFFVGVNSGELDDLGETLKVFNTEQNPDRKIRIRIK